MALEMLCGRLMPSLRLVTTTPLHRCFSLSAVQQHLQMMSSVRVVDNSELGQRARLMRRKVKVIGVYNKTRMGLLGDKVLVAICGQKKKAYIVGMKMRQRPGAPRFDTNNVVLIDDEGAPLGTRITVPIPHVLRGHKKYDYSKVLAIASKLV